jgi:hypothetical protein
MDNASPGGHPIDRTWFNPLGVSQAVAMNYRPIEEIRHGCQTNVRMRAYVKIVFWLHLNRTKVVKEYKGPDASLIGRG